MNSVRVCTDEFNKNVLGIRLTYSRYEDNGRLIEEKFLESHGTTEETGIVYCQTIDFMNGEYINSLGFGFTNTDLVQFLYRTNFETIGSYGSGATEGIVQTPLATFSDGGIMLFGLQGRVSNGNLTALGIIGYDKSCLDEFIEKAGADFVWQKPGEEEPEPEDETEEDKEEEETVTAEPDDVEVGTVAAEEGGSSAGAIVGILILCAVIVTIVVLSIRAYRKDKACFKKLIEKVRQCRCNKECCRAFMVDSRACCQRLLRKCRGKRGVKSY